MFKLDISDAVNSVRREFFDLTGREFRSGVARAINHTAAKARTQASKEIRSEYRIRAKDLRPALTTTKASAQNIEGRLVAKGKNLPLLAFGAKQNKRGVSVNVTGQRKQIRSAFIATMRSGHKGVFARGHYKGGSFRFRDKRIKTSGPDLPITELTTVAVPIAMQNRKVLEATERLIVSNFPQRLRHELLRIRG